jgi:hypothetical protein
VCGGDGELLSDTTAAQESGLGPLEVARRLLTAVAGEQARQRELVGIKKAGPRHAPQKGSERGQDRQAGRQAGGRAAGPRLTSRHVVQKPLGGVRALRRGGAEGRCEAERGIARCGRACCATRPPPALASTPGVTQCKLGRSGCRSPGPGRQAAAAVGPSAIGRRVLLSAAAPPCAGMSARRRS